jgi:hypothetical protein
MAEAQLAVIGALDRVLLLSALSYLEILLASCRYAYIGY